MSSPEAGMAILSVENLQENVSAVIQIMRVNVQKALIRESRLQELDDRASALSQSASQFQLQARELRQTNVFKNNVKGALLLATPILLFMAILYCKFPEMLDADT